MKTLFKILILVGTLNSCNETRTTKVAEFEDYIPGKDYFPNKAEVGYAQNFSVEYYKNYKVVRARVPYSNTDLNVEENAWETAFTDIMVLVQKGTPPPPLIKELEGAIIIEVPAKTVAGNADEAPTRFMALDAQDKLVGLGLEAVANPELKARMEEGSILPIGASWHSQPNLELLLTMNPGITLLTVANLKQSNGVTKSRELGLKVAPDFSWSESSFLAQLEWIKYDALFLNAENEANQYFDKIKSICDSLSSLVRHLEPKPEAIWAYHNRGGTWRIRANGSFAQLIEAAGGINPFADTLAPPGWAEGITFPDEIVLERARNVEYIMSFQTTTTNWPSANYMKTIPAYRNGNIYHHLKRYQDDGASDWYQSAAMRPDLVLMDLIRLFHPEVLPNHELFFLDLIEVN